MYNIIRKWNKVAWSDESCFISPYVDTVSFPNFVIQGGRVMVDLEKVHQGSGGMAHT